MATRRKGCIHIHRFYTNIKGSSLLNAMWYLEKRTGIKYGKPELKYQPFYLITIRSHANYSTSLNLGLHINKLNYLDIADTTPVQWYFCIWQSHKQQISTLCLYNNCKMRSLPGKWLCFVLLTMQINHSQVWCIYWYFRLERKTPPSIHHPLRLFQKRS